MKTMGAILLGLGLISWAGAETEIEKRLAVAGDNAGQIKTFLESAREGYGKVGEKAAVFLVEGMPESDLKSLQSEFLLENLQLALKAREEFAWAKALPEAVFLNDVVPYASLDETREAWRKKFYAQCAELVKGCKTSTEAAQAINAGLFKLINVHYNTGRKAPNQSPAESIELGKATCTGLSIIMVDACRAVGVPARVAGTALWSNKRGNHTWVEVYDSGTWYFTGADEYNKGGLNRAWFVGDASKAIADDWRHAIWATSWKKTGTHFPMVWSLENKEVAGVNVTSRYAKEGGNKAKDATIYLRVWEKQGGARLAAKVELMDGSGKVLQSVTSKAGTTDLNDMPTLKAKTGRAYRLRVTHEGKVRWAQFEAVKEGEGTVELVWPELGKGNVPLKSVKEWLALLPEERHLSVPTGVISEEDAIGASQLIWETLSKELKDERKAEVEAKVVKAAGKEMKYLEKWFGKAKTGERSLWISMHGGGGAPPRVNEQQWHNQIRLYAPAEGIVVAPRAPTDTWNLWHQGHIDDLFDRLISNFVVAHGVSPDRVYLMGYSAGGDGVYQLAPRMADRFAAASMMAGHPNNANPLGLRNLPFMIFVGGKDGAYSRNKVAVQWGEKLAKLRAGDVKGYEHKVTVYPEFGHWMNGKDREALPWMAARTRNPWPKKIVWHQSGRTHERFYWLSVPKGSATGGQTVSAEVKGQRIEVSGDGLKGINLRLSDALLNLDEPVVVSMNGKEVFQGKVERTVQAIWDSLQQRPDVKSVATGVLELKF